MDQEKVKQIFTDIGEGEGDKALIAAKELINSSNDSDLRKDVSDMYVRLLKAKDSVAQEKVLAEYIKYVKTQMALVYVQAFRGGRSHQIMLQNEQTQKLIAMASKLQEQQAVNPQEFLLPEGAPIQWKLNEEDEEWIDGKYMGTKETEDCVIVETTHESDKPFLVDVPWSRVAVDKDQLATFMQENGLIAQDSGSTE